MAGIQHTYTLPSPAVLYASTVWLLHFMGFIKPQEALLEVRHHYRPAWLPMSPVPSSCPQPLPNHCTSSSPTTSPVLFWANTSGWQRKCCSDCWPSPLGNIPSRTLYLQTGLFLKLRSSMNSWGCVFSSSTWSSAGWVPTATCSWMTPLLTQQPEDNRWNYRVRCLAKNFFIKKHHKKHKFSCTPSFLQTISGDRSPAKRAPSVKPQPVLPQEAAAPHLGSRKPPPRAAHLPHCSTGSAGQTKDSRLSLRTGTAFTHSWHVPRQSLPPEGLCVAPTGTAVRCCCRERAQRSPRTPGCRAELTPLRLGQPKTYQNPEPPPQAVSAAVRPKAAFQTLGRGNFADEALRQRRRATAALRHGTCEDWCVRYGAANKGPRGAPRAPRAGRPGPHRALVRPLLGWRRGARLGTAALRFQPRSVKCFQTHLLKKNRK